MDTRSMLATLALALALTSCATQRATTPQVVTAPQKDSTYIGHYETDTIYVRELINPRADTIVLEREIYRYRVLRDTIYKERVDSIPFKVVETVETPYVPEITRVTSRIGWCVIALIVALALAKLAEVAYHIWTKS